MSLAQPITCPILVGRGAQIATISHLIAESCDGARRMAVISGEAGVGKSRLVAEASQRASTHGFAIFRGRCFEDDRALPYAPLSDLLRGYLSTCPPDALVPTLGPAAPHLIDLLPEFAALLPAHMPTQDVDSDQVRRRIAQAFVQFFSHAAAQQPRLVIVEDLHWSDEASLAALLTLARQSIAQPLLLLLTYRDDEAQPNLTQMLGMLERERRSSAIHLERLRHAEIASATGTCLSSSHARRCVTTRKRSNCFAG